MSGAATAEAVQESHRLRRVASAAAAASARHLLTAFRSPMLVEHKGGAHDLVTEHDLASEAIIRDLILREEPDSTVLGEEGGAVGDGRVVWHVDPIDGTVNFANGIAFWCVSVAAAIEGEVVAGVVLDPVGGHEFAADLGGAWLDGARLGPPAAPTELGATVVSSFPAALDLASHGAAALEATGRLLEAFGTTRAMGSGALGLVHVAAGWADATFDLHTHPWDVAAGSLVVRMAGGRYVGFVDGRPDEDPRTLHLAPSYYAVGPGAHYPTLDSVVRRLSGSRLPAASA
ncbi:inositol monophosphatase family protein [Phycicoccus sonneratiae]|uniref:inositol-phosphate phosphatase n=1 Tax=Phycicoccus sonneratiae TaxID=2807628 RepID=A0ABS2CPL4_9MICO|nr:inositol monophosphatase [Phycicoccus sonneraticus]MBM6401821.1 inositol monophosphatase [Phycicoccus sonneraticus]